MVSLDRLCRICENPVQAQRTNALVCQGECAKEQARRRTAAWREGKPTGWEPYTKQERALINRRAKLKMHGLDKDQALLMAENSEGICNACGELAILVVDHDHSHCEGKYGCSVCLRGYLCQPCNWTLGASNDNINRLNSLMSYLKESDLAYQLNRILNKGNLERK